MSWLALIADKPYRSVGLRRARVFDFVAGGAIAAWTCIAWAVGWADWYSTPIWVGCSALNIALGFWATRKIDYFETSINASRERSRAIAQDIDRMLTERKVSWEDDSDH